MDKTVVDSWELRDKGNGFESGVLLCCQYRLRGYLCNQCRSQSKCDKMMIIQSSNGGKPKIYRF